MKSKVYNLLKQLGTNIKVQRTKKGLTQEDVAADANISLVTMGNIETGKSPAKITTLAQIAEALDIDLYKLFIFED